MMKGRKRLTLTAEFHTQCLGFAIAGDFDFDLVAGFLARHQLLEGIEGVDANAIE